MLPSNHRIRQKRLRMESLEQRQLMAGDLQAVVSGGNLYLTEAAQAVGQSSNVRIVQLSPGVVQLQGLEPPGSDISTLINGRSAQNFSVTGDLIARLGGGDDLLQLGYDDGSSAPSFRSAQIDVSRPPPTGTKGGTTTILPAVSDQDFVMIWGAKIADSMTIVTGDGDDSVFVGSAIVGDGGSTDQLKILTGAGKDGVKLKATTVRGDVMIQTFASASELDGDFVGIDSGVAGLTKIEGTINVTTGGGGDSLFVGQPNMSAGAAVLIVDESMVIDTGAGDDRLELYNARIGKPTSQVADHDLLIRTGAGADNVLMKNIAVLEYIDLLMYELAEADADLATLDNIHNLASDMSIRMGEGADGLSLNNTGSNNLYVEMGGGNDRLNIYSYVTALLSSNLSGGLGFDTLTFIGQNAFGVLHRYGWDGESKSR